MATRIHGRNGRMYAAATSAGAAVPQMFMSTWGISFATDKAKVTAQGDTGHVYVSGLPDASGTYSGFFDADGGQFYTAAVDGVARPFYLYPVASVTTKYWFGTALFDFSVEVPVEGAASVTGSWAAASSVAAVGFT